MSITTNVNDNSQYDVPSIVSGSLLWERIGARPEYLGVMLQIRAAANVLAGVVSKILPEYTDHSVRHMDRLWQITARVLTQAEIQALNPGEAFLLGASFYLHDLGMAFAVTNAGKDQIRLTTEYQAAYKRLKRLGPGNEGRADELALREATRELHAQKALELATQPLPGLDRCLIEDSDFRDRWAYMVGQIAESHHWTLEQVERSLGGRGAVPGPDGESLDLAYVACVLRVVDFAHINRERALKTERALRSEIPPESVVHWDAQAHVTGPERDHDLLVFGCTKPLENVDAWWLFFDTASELDAEIRAVSEYLVNRSISEGRFSLQGVKGIENPARFNQFVRLPERVLPIDIRVQPDSMERVVELLGGRNIYGPDRLAPIRELIQNARDAIELRRSLEIAAGKIPTPGEITISLEQRGKQYSLTVQDNGVGMTRSVVRKHLLGVGSDFWNSVDFDRDFSKAVDFGFRPIGRFGIGFLSVFMLGDEVEVETEAVGNNRNHLMLHGVGRRGELRETATTGHAGTEVRIALKAGGHEIGKRLADIVRARAPMLSIPILVKICAPGSVAETLIEPGWWKNEGDQALLSFVENWRAVAYDFEEQEDTPESKYFRHYAHHVTDMDYGGKWSLTGWPGVKPQQVGESERLICMGGAPSFGVIACSQGIAIQAVRCPDVTGVFEMGTVDLTVSRETLIDNSDSLHGQWGSRNNPLINKIREDLRPAVVAAIDDMNIYGMLPGRIDFLRGLSGIFGEELLDKTTLNWIPVTEPPGDLIHRSKEQFLAQLAQNPRILLVVGVGPGGGYSIAASQIPAAELSRMLVLAISKEEVKVGYSAREALERDRRGETLQGSLDQLISAVPKAEWKLILVNFLLNCIARGWKTSAEKLRLQAWVLRYKDDVLWAALKRPQEG
jgi:hypothetical protein